MNRFIYPIRNAVPRTASHLLAVPFILAALFSLPGCDDTSVEAPTPQAGQSPAFQPATQPSTQPTSQPATQSASHGPCCPLPVGCDDETSATDKSLASAAATQPSESKRVTETTFQSLERPDPQAVVRLTDPSPTQTQQKSAGQSWRASNWIDPIDREAFYLDFDATDHDGRRINLNSLVGKPLAISFIFTRCPQPDMCPLITLTMADLQSQLADQGLADDVTLVLISYDPAYDTPQRLKDYATSRGLQFTNAIMLRPDHDRFMELLSEFQVGADYRPDGSIGHFVELLLVDHQGRFARDYLGAVWDNNAVLADLKKLVEEAAPNDR